MPLVQCSDLVDKLSPPLDQQLTKQLVEEFVSLERRYILRDWEPAELDGGQFAEVLARILYHIDANNLNRTKKLNDCLRYIEFDGNAHAIQPRSDALHIAKVLRTIYKFRSQRGAVHISPTYRPNEMDSRLIIEASRWCFADTIRVFWSSDRPAVAKAIRELLQFEVPCIGRFEDVLVVQRTDLSAIEEILVLLHYAGEQGFTRRELGSHSQSSPASVTRSIQQLASPDCREIVQLRSKKYRLTDLGSVRVRTVLSHKLVLQ